MAGVTIWKRKFSRAEVPESESSQVQKFQEANVLGAKWPELY